MLDSVQNNQLHVHKLVDSTSPVAPTEGLMAMKILANDVYIEFLQTAPWNDAELAPLLGIKQKLSGVGTILLRSAVMFSKQQGFLGRLALTSLSGAVGFYEQAGFIQDSRSGNLSYVLMEVEADSLLERIRNKIGF